MILLSVEEITKLHTKLVSQTGGLLGVKDIGLLESAIYGALASFDDIEVYKTIEEKAARLAFSIIKNHAFIDGNKRIGILVLLMTLKLNMYNIVYTQKELITLGLSIADGCLSYDDIVKWICSHAE